MRYPHAAYALLAAALFGLSTPFAKTLLGPIDPWMLAGLFYLASGIGLGVFYLVRPSGVGRREQSLTRRDAPWLAGAILSGGVAGPVLLMVGLARTPASTASLLLTMEGVATALLAWLFFRENVGHRILIGLLAIVCGAAILAWNGSPGWDGLFGPLAIVAACLAWGLDNNLTRQVALADPVQIAMIKGLVAGPITLLLAFVTGAPLPPTGYLFGAAAVGVIGYGLSLVLFVLALRHLGTARTGAYFSTAPFIGALAAIPLLREPVSFGLIAGGCLMGLGVWLHLTERHEHQHLHGSLEHAHKHTHDVHHRHEAEHPGRESAAAHSHRHRHASLKHSHPHLPDAHHHHGH